MIIFARISKIFEWKIYLGLVKEEFGGVKYKGKNGWVKMYKKGLRCAWYVSKSKVKFFERSTGCIYFVFIDLSDQTFDHEWSYSPIYINFGLYLTLRFDHGPWRFDGQDWPIAHHLAVKMFVGNELIWLRTKLVTN